MLSLTAVSLSNIGNLRANNEDAFYIGGVASDSAMLDVAGKANVYHEYETRLNRTACLAVFDGMGGANAGEVASAMAASALRQALNSRSEVEGLVETGEVIQFYSASINEEIFECSRKGKRLNGMGTTFACLLFSEEGVISLNAGDSRALILRDEHLQMLSLDHSKAAQLIRSGHMTSSEARGARERHQLTRHFGMPPEYGIMTCYSTNVVAMQKGDRFLLCTDGLFDPLDDGKMEAILVTTRNIMDCAEVLMAEALAAGGQDNITLMLADIT